ncbi:MAG: YqgE/AlgH family protein, partial [Proteobacteria bacterium]|nr:YqgE/AlgH family protein [Pseudomonadota bacterium]
MSAKPKSAAATGTAKSTLEGQLLIAMPTMSDKRFKRSVIYMCHHTAEGAMGIIINQPSKKLTFAGLLRQLNLADEESDEELPAELISKAVHVGGPVSSERGFVLHSNDYVVDQSTLRVADGICLTATLDILKAIAGGNGPADSLLALGYSGWAPGQLETEIQANGWLHCDADRDLVFGTD